MDPTYYNRFGARPPRKRSIKKISAAFGVALVGIVYTAAMLLWPLQTLQAEPTVVLQQPTKDVSIDWPTYGQSAVFAPGYGMLDSSGSDKPVPMASITKIVTALTVLDKKPLAENSAGETITFTEADADSFHTYLAKLGSVAPVTPGQKISQRDVLNIMLVISANNYADSLAIWAFGSLDAHITAANQYLADNGLHNTQVADASGFSPKSRSTARDLVRLGSLALDEPAIAKAVNTRQVAVPGYGTVNSTNRLLQQDDGAIGIKTGTTDEAGSCLLFAKEYTVDGQTITIIGATLGAPNHVRLAADVAKVLESTRNGFAAATLAEKGHSFAVYQTAWGENIDVVTASEVRGVIWQGKQPSHDTSIADIDPRDVPDEVGTVTFMQRNHAITSAQLELKENIQSPDWWWRLSNPGLVLGW